MIIVDFELVMPNHSTVNLPFVVIASIATPLTYEFALFMQYCKTAFKSFINNIILFPVVAPVPHTNQITIQIG